MARLQFYEATAIPAAGTTTTTPIGGLTNIGHLEMFARFAYGSGGTSAKAFIQTSIDGGTTWFDIACFAFTTANASKVGHVSASGYLPMATVPTDGTLTDDTTRDGLIGDQVRVKLIVAGTYAGSALTLYATAKQDGASGLGISSITPGTAATSLGKAEDAAHTSGDVGVMMLGVRNNSAATAFGGSDGDYSAIAVDGSGRVHVIPGYGASGSDAASNTASYLLNHNGSTGALFVNSSGYNGSTWDRQRNNLEGTALASATRTASTNSADITNYNGRGVELWLNITAAPGVDTIQFILDLKDPVSGVYSAILASATIAVTGMTLFLAYPGMIDTAGSAASKSGLPVSRTFRVRMIHSGAGNFGYSVGYCIIL